MKRLVSAKYGGVRRYQNTRNGKNVVLFKRPDIFYTSSPKGPSMFSSFRVMLYVWQELTSVIPDQFHQPHFHLPMFFPLLYSKHNILHVFLLLSPICQDLTSMFLKTGSSSSISLLTIHSFIQMFPFALSLFSILQNCILSI